MHASTAPIQAAAADGTIGAKATIIKKRKAQELISGSALYLFAGAKRKSSISVILRDLGWNVLGIDILQGGKAAEDWD